MKKILLAGLVAGALVFGVSCIVNADELVTNGGFEIPLENPSFSGWGLSGTIVDDINDGSNIQVTDSNANSGNAAGAFGTVGSLTYLSQMLSTITGDQYNLSFFLWNTGDGSNKFQALWGGVVIVDLFNSNCFDYTQYTLNGLVATGESTELKFGFQNDPAFFYIDDISVQSSSHAPEPASMLLFGTGIAGLATVGRRKRS